MDTDGTKITALAPRTELLDENCSFDLSEADNALSSTATLRTPLPDSPPLSDERKKETGKTSLFLQCKVNLLRVLLLLIRQPIVLLMEILIPILFVLASLLLWKSYTNFYCLAENVFSSSRLEESQIFLSGLTFLACYQTDAIPTLSSCDSLSVLAGELLCGTEENGVPDGFCASVEGVYYAKVVWMSSILYRVCLLPTLDQMFLLSWMQQLAFLLSSRQVSSSGDPPPFIMHSLYFSPDTESTSNLVSYFQDTSELFSYAYAKTVDTVKEATDYATKSSSVNSSIWAIIEAVSLEPHNFDVALHFNVVSLPTTMQTLYFRYTGGIATGTQKYAVSGFSVLQKFLYEYFLTNVTKEPNPFTSVAILPMSVDKHYQQDFLVQMGTFVPLVISFGFMCTVSQMTKRLVLEKELRLREAMLIMGLSEGVFYLSYLIILLIQQTVTGLIVVLILKKSYFYNCDFGFLFLAQFLFGISIIALSGLISSLFKNSKLAGLAAPIIYFFMLTPLKLIQYPTPSLIKGLSIFSPSCFLYILELMVSHEIEEGFDKHSVSAQGDNPTYAFSIGLLVVDCSLYTALMVYFDCVLPKDWGTQKNPFFCIIDPIRACFCKGKPDDAEDLADGRAPNGVFEEVQETEKSAIQIRGLRKVFGSGKKKFIAVNNLFFNMKEGDITVLLGHNGAGKSTTMNMMTGMIDADGGDCLIYGKSVRHNLSAARQEIGYCPQHNILWPNLTCREHLWFYASLKGLRGIEREDAIEWMAEAVGLTDKIDDRSSMLSGGQKRKLSVGIAFVGGSRLVFLDEPTAGMDATARRHTWEMLRKLSSSHSILLTTHFMDEADLLGDTVAIMSQGRLQCSGNNLFLKEKLGVGFVLALSVDETASREEIRDMITGFVVDAEELSSAGGEMAFRLPMESKSVFPALLGSVENGSSLGIAGFTLSATTLEEIFIKVAEADQKNSKNEACANSNEVSSADFQSTVWSVSVKTNAFNIFLCQMRAMMIKRLWCILRDRRTQFFQIVCPVLCVTLAMLLSLITLFPHKTQTISSDIYGTDVVIDVAGCDGFLNYAIPFASQATTVVNPGGSTNAASLSAYELDTYFDHPGNKARYLGLVCEQAVAGSTAAFILFNASSLVSLPVGVYDLYNGYYQKAVGSSSFLTTVSQPMPSTASEKQFTDSIYAMMIATVVMIPFTFIPSTFTAWVVRERQCKARHLQSVSGLSFYVYWLSNYLFDICSYFITMMLVIIIFLIFKREEYVSSATFGGTFLVFVLYGLSGVVMAYAVSFFFNDYATAQNTVLLVNFITGFLLVMIVVVLQVLGGSAEDIGNKLRFFFRLVPSFCVGEGILNLAVLQMEIALGAAKTVWSMSVIGWPCVYMALEIPLYTFIVLFIDHPERRQRSERLFHNPDAPPEVIEDLDEDVQAEEKNVRTEERLNDLVTVQNLRKVYGNGKVAVRNLTFGVKAGEVFGFLGTNGAGKTTTISILCQEFFPTSGHATVCGYDIVSESQKALRCIGYCPQFDATLDLLTVEEHLYLYAGVRAIADEDRARVVESLMELCELTQYRTRTSQDLSGGNRRKLSVALSLIGGPRVVFLDEPSAGMDPVARRGLWTAIQAVANNCAVVLTTHHLEEVEALAHRVAIMVDGVLKCIGNKTHLKTKYGSGFELTARLTDESVQTREGVEHFIESACPGAVVVEYRARRLTYSLPVGTKLSDTFAIMEKNAHDLNIQEYSVSQTSIEQVFLRISEEAEWNREEEDVKNMERKCCCCCCCV